MKRIIILASVVVSAITVLAEPTIENVIVRQRWPWSRVVDIDFTVVGGSTGVKFVAKYDGVEPFTLAEKDLSGDFAEILEPGIHRMTWDPEKAGLGKTALRNFSVSVEPEDKTYLILNLVDGSYRYAAAEPEGGWLADPSNYQTNIVFRRVPKGTRFLGLTKELGDLLAISNYGSKHEVTLTSDYYLSVFMVTEGQHQYIVAKAADEDKDVSSYSHTLTTCNYSDMRGLQSDGIDWPSTKYNVRSGSLISNLRSIVESSFPSEWIVDLPTSSQWEYAAKADTPFEQLLSVGGKADDENFWENYTNLVDQVAIWHHNLNGGSKTLVGRKLPNGWGFYDMVGLGFEWCLDWYANSTTDYSGIDPVGPNTGSARTRRSMYTPKPTSPGMVYYTTAYLGRYAPNDEGNKCGYRLCIHLKSLFK